VISCFTREMAAEAVKSFCKSLTAAIPAFAGMTALGALPQNELAAFETQYLATDIYY
jgi:hypothetical protein